MKRCFAKLSALLLLALTLPLTAQDLASFEKRVTMKTLPNGLTVILLRRPGAPVFSFFTMVDTGSAQDPLSKTGLAHMMEHMAFKGTPDIGTTNYADEKVALAKVEEAYAAYEARTAGPEAGPVRDGIRGRQPERGGGRASSRGPGKRAQ